jgi:hypothetical protein
MGRSRSTRNLHHSRSQELKSQIKSLPDHIDLIQNQIKKMSEEEKIVSYSTISTLAKQEWEKLNPNKIKKFTASDGWVSSFIKRIGFSSQAVSLRSSSRGHRKIENHKEEVDQYKKTFSDFVLKHGKQRIVNFDETSFSCLTRKIQTIVPKNSQRQPRIRQYPKGRGLSIGCLITSDGQKLKSILVAKGKTSRSLIKYGNYQSDSRCILTQSPSGWFTQSENTGVSHIPRSHNQKSSFYD